MHMFSMFTNTEKFFQSKVMLKFRFNFVFNSRPDSLINRLISSKYVRLYSQSSESTKQDLNCRNVYKINVKNALRSKPSDQLVSISVNLCSKREIVLIYVLLWKGWVRGLRKQKPVFIHLNDGSVDKHIQVVIDKGIPMYANI